MGGRGSEYRATGDVPCATAHSRSHLIDAGIDVVKISRRLGHASVDITLRVYAHLFRKRDDKSSAAINAAVASLFQGYATLPLLACFGWQSGGKWVQSFTSVLIAHRLSV